MSKGMKERTERWIILPFSFGCSSHSSVAVGSPSPLNDAACSYNQQGGQKSSSITKKSKTTLNFKLPKSKLSHGIRRLIRSLKSVSQLFVYKETIDEEEEIEMEIGYPTDVKHLTHIGWDGSTTINNAAKGWENLTPSEIISFPPISLKQFEVAMAEQAAAATVSVSTGDKHV